MGLEHRGGGWGSRGVGRGQVGVGHEMRLEICFRVRSCRAFCWLPKGAAEGYKHGRDAF